MAGPNPGGGGGGRGKVGAMMHWGSRENRALDDESRKMGNNDMVIVGIVTNLGSGRSPELNYIFPDMVMSNDTGFCRKLGIKFLILVVNCRLGSKDEAEDAGPYLLNLQQSIGADGIVFMTQQGSDQHYDHLFFSLYTLNSSLILGEALPCPPPGTAINTQSYAYVQLYTPDSGRRTCDNHIGNNTKSVFSVWTYDDMSASAPIQP